MLRCLKEFRIRGVKTNIHFLINVLEHPEFQSGKYNVNFIEEHPELFELKPDRDRGTRLLRYIADVTINGYSGAGPQVVPDFEPIQMPSTLDVSPAAGTKQKFDELGPDKFSKWLSEQKQVFFTDTTWRDACLLYTSGRWCRRRPCVPLELYGANCRRNYKGYGNSRCFN